MSKTKIDWKTLGKRDWTRFYTISNVDEERVDQIEIDVQRGKYRLCTDCDMSITDGVDQYGEDIISYYIPRALFDIITKGVAEEFAVLNFCL